MTLAPARKLYRIGLLFTYKTSEFGAISVTEWSCAAPISNVESHISDRCSYYNGELFESARKNIRKSVTITKGAGKKPNFTSDKPNANEQNLSFSIIGIRFLASVVRRFTLGLDKIIHLRGKKKSFHHTLYFLVSQARDNTTVHAYSTSFNTKLALTL